MTKKITLIILIVSVLYFDVYYLIVHKVDILSYDKANEMQIFKIDPKEKSNKDACLKDNEISDYVDEGEYANKLLRISDTIPAIITVSDKTTKKEIKRFEIENVSNSIFTLWLMPCGIYVNKYFNYDYGSHKFLPGFRSELWKYDYRGNGKFLFTIYEPSSSKTRFGPSFAIDSEERYIALVKQDSLKKWPNESIVIKDLSTLEIIFDLSGEKLIKEYPNLNSTFEVGDHWSNDGRFLWVGFSDPFYGDIYFDVFVRIDTTSGEHQVFEKPGYSDALNPDNGYITYMDGGEFLFEEPSPQQIKEWKAKGNFVSFYLYNLITGKEILLEKGNNPTYDYQPKWLDENTLEYKLPDGTLKYHKL